MCVCVENQTKVNCSLYLECQWQKCVFLDCCAFVEIDSRGPVRHVSRVVWIKYPMIWYASSILSSWAWEFTTESERSKWFSWWNALNGRAIPSGFISLLAFAFHRFDISRAHYYTLDMVVFSLSDDSLFGGWMVDFDTVSFCSQMNMNLPQSVAILIVRTDAAFWRNHCATWRANTRIGWISSRMHHVVSLTIAGWSMRWWWCIQTAVTCRYIDIG